MMSGGVVNREGEIECIGSKKRQLTTQASWELKGNEIRASKGDNFHREGYFLALVREKEEKSVLVLLTLQAHYLQH